MGLEQTTSSRCDARISVWTLGTDWWRLKLVFVEIAMVFGV
jgi:hypothetical protein